MSKVQHYLVVGTETDEYDVVHGQECYVLVIEPGETYTDRRCYVGYLEGQEGIDTYFRHWMERPGLLDRLMHREVIKPGRHAIRVGENNYPSTHELHDAWIELGEEEQR